MNYQYVCMHFYVDYHSFPTYLFALNSNVFIGAIINLWGKLIVAYI